jgi:hypothetical protein
VTELGRILGPPLPLMIIPKNPWKCLAQIDILTDRSIEESSSLLGGPPMVDRRKFFPGIFIPVFVLFMGIIVIINFASKPGFETFRAVDVIRLIAAGMCFGAGLAALVMFLFFGNRSN